MVLWSAITACPPDHHAVADRHAAGEARLAGDQDIFANGRVVTDMDQIVDFGSVADSGRPERAAVDAGAGADFDGIADNHGAERMDAQDIEIEGRDLTGLPRPLDAILVRRHEAEPVRADGRVVMQDATLADAAVLADPHARMQDAAGPDLRPGRHSDLGEQHRSRADRRFRSDDAERSDRGAVADVRSRVDNGAGVDTGKKVQRRRQELRQPRPA